MKKRMDIIGKNQPGFQEEATRGFQLMFHVEQCQKTQICCALEKKEAHQKEKALRPEKEISRMDMDIVKEEAFLCFDIAKKVNQYVYCAISWIAWGRKKSVKMSELANLLSGLGYQKVKTYIQSGNAVLESHEEKAVASK